MMLAIDIVHCSKYMSMSCGPRADLQEEDVKPLKSKMADNLFQQVPVGVGGSSDVK